MEEIATKRNGEIDAYRVLIEDGGVTSRKQINNK